MADFLQGVSALFLDGVVSPSLLQEHNNTPARNSIEIMANAIL